MNAHSGIPWHMQYLMLLNCFEQLKKKKKRSSFYIYSIFLFCFPKVMYPSPLTLPCTSSYIHLPLRLTFFSLGLQEQYTNFSYYICFSLRSGLGVSTMESQNDNSVHSEDMFLLQCFKVI